MTGLASALPRAVLRDAFSGLARRAIVVVGALFLGIAAAAAQPATVTSDLNLRAGPGTNFRVILSMPRGSRVDILDCRGTWCQVDFRGRVGWASANFLAVGQAVRPEPPRAVPIPIPIPIPGITPPGITPPGWERGRDWGRGRDRAGRCRADRAEFIIGRRATESRLEQALDASRARTLRVEEPGRFYTQEFRPDRLTVSVDRRRIVVDVECR